MVKLIDAMSVFDIFSRFVLFPFLILVMLVSCKQESIDNVDVADENSVELKYGIPVQVFLSRPFAR